MTSCCDFCKGPHNLESCNLRTEVDRGILCTGIPHDNQWVVTCGHHAHVKHQLQQMSKASHPISANSALHLQKIAIFDDSITHVTALLPVCSECTNKAFAGQAIPAGFDGCRCATLIVGNEICWYCEVRRIADAKAEAQDARTKSTVHHGGEGVELKCQCGNLVTSPEKVRKCAGCNGFVARPFHNFNGEEVDFEFASVTMKAPGNHHIAVNNTGGQDTFSGMPLGDWTYADDSAHFWNSFEDVNPTQSIQSSNNDSEMSNDPGELPHQYFAMANGVGRAGEASSPSNQATGSTLGSSPPEVDPPALPVRAATNTYPANGANTLPMAPNPTPSRRMEHTIRCPPQMFAQPSVNTNTGHGMIGVGTTTPKPQRAGKNLEISGLEETFQKSARGYPRTAEKSAYDPSSTNNAASSLASRTGMKAPPAQHTPNGSSAPDPALQRWAEANGFKLAQNRPQSAANNQGNRVFGPDMAAAMFQQRSLSNNSAMHPSHSQAYGNGGFGSNANSTSDPNQGAHGVMPTHQFMLDCVQPSYGHQAMRQPEGSNGFGEYSIGMPNPSPVPNSLILPSQNNLKGTPQSHVHKAMQDYYQSTFAAQQASGGATNSGNRTVPSYQHSFNNPHQGQTQASPYYPKGMPTGGATTMMHNSNSQSHALGTVPTTPAAGANQVSAGMLGGELDVATYAGMLANAAANGMRNSNSQPHAYGSCPTTPAHGGSQAPARYFGGGSNRTPRYGGNPIVPEAQFPKHISRSAPGRHSRQARQSSSPLAPQHQQHNRVQKQRGGRGQQRGTVPEKQFGALFDDDEIRQLHTYGLAAPRLPDSIDSSKWTHKQKIDAVLCTNRARYMHLEHVRRPRDLCGFPNQMAGWAAAMRELKKLEVTRGGVGEEGEVVVGCTEVLFVFQKHGWNEHVPIDEQRREEGA